MIFYMLAVFPLSFKMPPHPNNPLANHISSIDALFPRGICPVTVCCCVFNIYQVDFLLWWDFLWLLKLWQITNVFVFFYRSKYFIVAKIFHWKNVLNCYSWWLLFSEWLFILILMEILWLHWTWIVWLHFIF